MFFSPRNPDTALGMYSPLYFITLFIVLALVAFFLMLSKNMTHKTVKRTIITLGIILWITEFIKMAFTGVVYGISSVQWIPLYFCSMEMYACVMLSFKNKTLQTTGLTFIFFGGIIGATAFFCYPDACIPNYPLFHYMTLRTFFYHGSMIYMGFLVIITKFYTPKLCNFREYAVFLGITCICAYIMNLINDTNLMYISKPISLDISKKAFEVLGVMYPTVFAILQLVVPFFISYGIYNLVIKVLKKPKEQIRLLEVK